jgi:type IX secretion system PorP/SprF family membrane protein
MNIIFSALALRPDRLKAKDSAHYKFRFVARLGRISALFLLLMGAYAADCLAQDDPQYSQNMYNRLPVNPGYAGSTGGMCATSLLRNQWVGFEGAPKSINFAIDGLVEAMHGGIGFAITQDRLGLNSSINAKIAYAYRMRMFETGRLAFGLSGGIMQRSLDLSRANIDPTSPDPILVGADPNPSSIKPDFDFGAYFNTQDYYIGASVTHLNQAKLSYSNFTIQVRRHFYLMGGYNYAFNRTLTLKPSFFVKSDATSTQADVNLTLLYNNTIWAGVSYRIDDSVILMAGMNITNELKFGYSYDITTSAISLVSKGSHELMLRYCFKIKNNKPAYMNRTVRFL